MPRTVAQWTGLAVTVTLVFGCDADVVCALPLGVFAAALAALLIELDGWRRGAAAAVPVRQD